MSIIDLRMAKEIAEWEKKHPKEAEEYAQFHREQSELFTSHKISYEEFKKRHDEWKPKTDEAEKSKES